MRSDRIAVARLKEVLDYDPSTGIFRWKPGREKHLKARAGKVAGSQTTSYVMICIDGNYIGAHRLAWMYVHESQPKGCIDHINGLCTDNRIDNLRDVTHHQNTLNRKLSKRNSSGVHGVDYHRASKKWRARVTFKSAQHYSLHDTEEEAIAGVKALREKHHGNFIRQETLIKQERLP